MPLLRYSYVVLDPVVERLIEQYGMTVSLAQAAEILGCHPETVRRMHRAGRLPGHRVGRAIRIFVPELVNWIRAGGDNQYQPEARRAPTRSDRPSWMIAVNQLPGGR